MGLGLVGFRVLQLAMRHRCVIVGVWHVCSLVFVPAYEAYHVAVL